MNKYELMYIIDAHSPQTTKEDIAKQVADTAAKSEVNVINSHLWLEKHKMSFPIKKIWEGTYYLLNLEAQSSAINKMQALLRMNEHLLRFLTIRQAVVRSKAFAQGSVLSTVEGLSASRST
ncbi:MAG: 30S ribosomal protein S6 [Candidatus Omnitrophica bacterium]|nr:30S ribosomal protein S6 [Candidatus Omnitrophota bacterium]